MTTKGVLYDPPSGWRYGFPKPYKPLPGETVEQTLVRDGYPAKEFNLDGKAYWVRYIYLDDPADAKERDTSPAGGLGDGHD